MPQRGRTMVFVIMAALFAFLPAAAASAQDGEAVTTTITFDDPETGERAPAAGVTIVVTDADGNEVGSAATDEEGIFLLELPGPGRYTLTLDETTLPEGVALRTPERNPATVNVEAGQTGRVIFGTTTGDGGGAGAGRITTRAVVQLTVEGIKLGLFLAMAAIGLSLIFGTTGLVNFSHGELVGWGMLIAYLFNFYGFAGFLGFMEGWPPPFGGGVNLILATAIAIVAGMGMGWAMDAWIFAPLRRRGTGLIAQMVVTIGISLVLRYMYLFAFRGTPRFYGDYTAQSAMSIGIVQITPKDLVASILAIVVLVGVGLFMLQTRTGKAMRAVSDNRDLAESSGINVQRVIRLVWVLGGGLGALGGVLFALSEQVAWNTGFRILLLIFASVVLGGLGTAFGALVGSLIVGIGIQVSTLFIPVELKNVGALILLILALIIRPQGILGRKERVG